MVVIAYEEWQRRFAGDDGIVGRTIRLGDTEHVVVGVMPEGFRFPINHLYWVPFRLSAASVPWGEGPAIMVFARLADGATLKEARTVLAALGARVAPDHPATHEHMRPTVRRYALRDHRRHHRHGRPRRRPAFSRRHLRHDLVHRRTSAQGVRHPLRGADPRRLLAGIFAHAAKQLGGGVLAGMFLAFLIRGPVDGRGLILVPSVAAFMVMVGLLAAIGPARRGPRHPADRSSPRRIDAAPLPQRRPWSRRLQLPYV